MTEYFEDMWIGLESELEQFDSYAPDNHFVDQEAPSSTENLNHDNPHFEAQTYETLINNKNAPDPTHEQLRSTNRKERIQAIKELYNKEPTIINWASVEKLHKTASRLYRKGFVKEGNSIMSQIPEIDYKNQK